MIGAPEGHARLSEGTRLYYEWKGDRSNPALLLLRPLGGDVGAWGPFRERLVERFHVLSFDLPGSGRSSPAPWSTTTRDMARMTLELLDRLEVRTTHVFGISLGGMIATWLAILGGDRIGCAVLASTPLRGIALAGRGMMHKAEFGRCLLGSAAETEACLSKQMLANPEHPGGERVEERILSSSPKSRSEMARLLLAGARHNPRRHLAQLRSPTLILAGEHDELVPPKAQRAFVRSLPDAEFSVIGGVAHDLTVEKPQEAADRVISFIDTRARSLPQGMALRTETFRSQPKETQ